jgi:hypothetical protein
VRVTSERLHDTMEALATGPVTMNHLAEELGVKYHTLYAHLRLRSASKETVRDVAAVLEDLAASLKEQARDLKRAAHGLPSR